MDLGNIIGGLQNLADIYTQVRSPPGFAPPMTPALSLPGGYVLEPDIPFIDITKKGHRHRRKRLATVSDISDIAQLKAVFGGGKNGAENLKVWIATHSR